jgi:ElaB/YqjD/DUF883 family membrane-anchored ribosome-binding protein
MAQNTTKNYRPETTEEQVRHVLEAGQRGASNTASDVRDRVGEIAGDAKDKATEIASDVKDKATEIASDVRERASDAGAQAADTIDDAMTATGGRMTDAAQTIRDKAPAEGKVADVAAVAATALERGGTYLQQSDLNDVQSDLERMIRQHPIETLLVGLGVGYLIARATRR